MLPPNQRLRAVQNGYSALDRKLGLIVNHKFLFPNRAGKVLKELFKKQFRFSQLVVIDGNVLIKAVSQCVSGLLCPVKPPLHVHRLVCTGINAHPQANPAAHPQRRGVQDVLIILPMRTVDQEGIPISATDKAPVRLNAFLQPTTDAAQDIIAVIPTVLFIDQVEMADIHLDAIHLQFLVEYVELIGVVEKEVLVVQPRELIALHGTDNALVI